MSPLITPLVLLTALPDSGGLSAVWLLAQGQAGGGPSLLSFLPILAMGLLAYFLLIVPQKTKQRNFQQMLDGLKENDRVVTTGGIHGVVTNVQRDVGRLTLRIDESTGAKVRVSMWAIDSVVNEEK
ncbi:preprotein translocase subunit YajC [Botrimarina colliarenosi]|uniref:Sec translocon accessory complex subunit YajC n=1 Tax=Botrimarina colliarenosi TaxID=2528001 RepID=A0A5C6AIX2_9BACT|nr:preprotein translocase subunit YajC [Botrimarina colliarenosi]TWT99188.1 preprotein translocase subunit YajC [Botrimarina colliarenosi]